ncbi:MAG: FGGY family carbohydrate kinase, partial [Firmicutes bacterium]|nr:FGGY family carbohydrate kinase [Bacillota bacterium]
MEPALIGVDLGTSSAKGVLVSSSGRVLAKASWSYSVQMPRPGWVEHDAEKDWWSGFVQVVNELITSSGVDSRAISAIGCSTIGPCVLPVDERVIPLRNGILYGVDCRASEEIEDLRSALGPGEATALTGNPVTSQSVLPKVMWLKKNEPEVYRRTRFVLDAPGYLAYKLTGRLSSDLFTAASAGVVDMNTLTKSARMFDASNVDPDLFPEPVWPATVVGRVTPEAARGTGLCPGTPVV